MSEMVVAMSPEQWFPEQVTDGRQMSAVRVGNPLEPVPHHGRDQKPDSLGDT